jgi:hypothetical protein
VCRCLSSRGRNRRAPANQVQTRDGYEMQTVIIGHEIRAVTECARPADRQSGWADPGRTTRSSAQPGVPRFGSRRPRWSPHLSGTLRGWAAPARTAQYVPAPAGVRATAAAAAADVPLADPAAGCRSPSGTAEPRPNQAEPSKTVRTKRTSIHQTARPGELSPLPLPQRRACSPP